MGHILGDRGYLLDFLEGNAYLFTFLSSGWNGWDELKTNALYNLGFCSSELFIASGPLSGELSR